MTCYITLSSVKSHLPLLHALQMWLKFRLKAPVMYTIEQQQSHFKAFVHIAMHCFNSFNYFTKVCIILFYSINKVLRLVSVSRRLVSTLLPGVSVMCPLTSTPAKSPVHFLLLCLQSLYGRLPSLVTVPLTGAYCHPTMVVGSVYWAKSLWCSASVPPLTLAHHLSLLLDLYSILNQDPVHYRRSLQT